MTTTRTGEEPESTGELDWPEEPPKGPGDADQPGPPSDDPAQQREGGVLNAFAHSFLVLWVIMAAGPLIWVVMNALKPTRELLEYPFRLPTGIHWDNFITAWTEASIGRYAMNSLIILVFSLTGTMLFGAMAAYVISRYDFMGNRAVYFLFIGGLMFPVFLALVPLYFVMDGMGLIDTRIGLILVYIAYSLPFTIFFLTAFFRTLPGAVHEAATIDGASHSRIFFQIMLPMAKPGMVSIGIFNFLGHWNQFVLPRVLNNGDEQNFVLPQGLASLMVQQGSYDSNWGALYGGLTIAMLPILVVYITFQRQVQAGLTAGAVK